MAIGFITGIEESYPRPHVLFIKHARAAIQPLL